MANANKFELPNVEGIYVVSLIGKGHFSRVYKGVQLVSYLLFLKIRN